MIPFSAVPEAQGLYDPRFESDACGVAFIANLNGVPSHEIVAQALTALHNLDHRGAAGAEASSGDGAGRTFSARLTLATTPPRGMHAALKVDLEQIALLAL